MTTIQDGEPNVTRTVPLANISKPPLHYRYTIDVDERGYAEIMQLVMKYGTGTGEGGGTAITTRIALAEAKVRTA